MLKTHKLKPTEIVCCSSYLQSVLLVGEVNSDDGFESIYEPCILDRKKAGVSLDHILKQTKPEELFDVLALYLPNKELSVLISACIAQTILEYERESIRTDFIQDVARFVNIENNFYMALNYIDAPLRDYLRQLQMGAPGKWQMMNYPLAYIALVSDKDNVIDPNEFQQKVYSLFTQQFYSKDKVRLINVAQDHLPYVAVGEGEQPVFRPKGGRPPGPRGPYKKTRERALEQDEVQKAFEQSQANQDVIVENTPKPKAKPKPAVAAKSKLVEIKPEIREASKVMGVFAKTKAVDVKSEDLERFRFLVNRFCQSKDFFDGLEKIKKTGDVLCKCKAQSDYQAHLEYYKTNNVVVLFAHVFYLLSENKVHYQYHEIIKQMQSYRKQHSLDFSMSEQKILPEFFKYLKKNI